jgi:hypothetical protein
MYLPSFFKVQFEKYVFNTKRAGMFAIPVVLWSNIFLIIQSDGPSTPISTTASTLTSSHPPEESKEEPGNNDHDLIHEYYFTLNSSLLSKCTISHLQTFEIFRSFLHTYKIESFLL